MSGALTVLPWVVAISTAAGVGGAVWLLLDALYGVYHRFWAMRRGQWESLLARWRTYEEDDDRLPEAALYGLDEQLIRRVKLASISAGAVIGVIVALNWSLPGGAGAATLGLFAPRIWLRARRKRRDWELLRQVRDFLTMLNLAAGLSGSMTWALRDLSERSDTLLAERLRWHLERQTQPLVILEKLADDMRSEHLYDLVRRMRAVEHGGGDRQESLKTVVEAISTDIQETAYEEVESAPMRLMFPMLITLLPPVLAILLGPMVARMLAVISGKAF